MNANLNMNTYRNYAYKTSEEIRRAYIATTRRREISAYISKILATPSVLKALLALKVVLGIACVIALFSVIGSIEAGSMNAMSGIITSLIIAGVESLCFIPIGSIRERLTRK